MIEVAARMRTKPGKREAFIKGAQESIAATRKEAGCISYELFASTEDENLLLYFELWETREALAAHMKSPHFLKWGKERVEQSLFDSSEVKIYEATERS